jgi:hypothetical protein
MKGFVCLRINGLVYQIDDKYKSVFLGYTKSSSPVPSRPSSKPPFPPRQQRRNINLHEMSAFEFLQVHTHELEPDLTPDETNNEDSPDIEPDPESSGTLLINAAKGSRSNPLPPGDIQRVLSKNSK